MYNEYVPLEARSKILKVKFTLEIKYIITAIVRISGDRSDSKNSYPNG